jgi:hypothetical protein
MFLTNEDASWDPFIVVGQGQLQFVSEALRRDLVALPKSVHTRPTKKYLYGERNAVGDASGRLSKEFFGFSP